MLSHRTTIALVVIFARLHSIIYSPAKIARQLRSTRDQSGICDRMTGYRGLSGVEAASEVGAERLLMRPLTWLRWRLRPIYCLGLLAQFIDTGS
jgi:hypothetical protein